MSEDPNSKDNEVSSDESYVKENSEQTDDDIQMETSWIEWYCSLNGNQFYVQIDEEYIRDEFNLMDIPNQVPYYTRALNIILDCGDDENYISEESGEDDNQQLLQSSIRLLYGLIHSRYILTHKGMEGMLRKYETHTFGTCPNYSCDNTPVLPIGIIDVHGHHTAKIYCPSCNEAYHPPKNNKLSMIDGAFFGTTFAHLFLLQHQSLIARGPTYYYVPKIHGFKVSANIRRELPNQSRGKCAP